MSLPPILVPGARAELGTHVFSEDGILRFARRFDPQPFHVDAEKAKASVLGGLCASGWHTAAVWMRLHRDYTVRAVAAWVAAGNPPWDIGPSPGFSKLRWIRPVYVGDAITYAGTTKTARASASRPGWHVVTGTQEGVNQTGQPVFSFESTAFVRYPAA